MDTDVPLPPLGDLSDIAVETLMADVASASAIPVQDVASNDVASTVLNLSAGTAETTNGNVACDSSSAIVQSNSGPDWLRNSTFEPPTGDLRARDDTDNDYAGEYSDDGYDSDNEYGCFESEELVGSPNAEGSEIGHELAKLYYELTRWSLFPSENRRDGNILSRNAMWVQWYLRSGDGRHILSDVMRARDLWEYQRHWRAHCILHIRSELFMELRSNASLGRMATDMASFTNDAYSMEGGRTPFLRCGISKLGFTAVLVHIKVCSNDALLNAKLLEDLSGATLGVCFLVRRESGSTIHKTGFGVAICRSVHFDGEDLDRVGVDGRVDKATMKFTLARAFLQKENFKLEKSDELYFLPVWNFASEIRIYRAIHNLPLLPTYVQSVLFGDTPHAETFSLYDTLLPPSNTMRQNEPALRYRLSDAEISSYVKDDVDPGSLAYLTRCTRNPDVRCGAGHLNAVIQCARVVGKCDPGCAGFAVTHGPPGTGKTNALLLTIGCLLHHSSYGHVNQHQRNSLSRRDNVLRCSTNPRAIRILVHCSSNAAVDDCMLKVHEEGIPDGYGGRLYPSMMRIARNSYDWAGFPCLRRYSVARLAEPYDRMFYPDSFMDRRSPSLKARRKAADECIIFFATSSTVGSSAFKQLKVDIDILLHDEAAQSLEMETLVTLVSTSSSSPNARSFYLAFGDPRQMEPFTHVPWVLGDSKVYTIFEKNSISVSLMQRLQDTGRCSQTLLQDQWRMHPAIAHITSRPFYNCEFAQPRPARAFFTSYNDGSNGAFSPFTFIDTSHSWRRFETKEEKGQLYNRLEASIVAAIIADLCQLRGWRHLAGKVAIISPYNAQVEVLRAELKRTLPFLQSDRSAKEFDAIVDSVDSMQGRERDIVILSTVRSNKFSMLGFLRNTQRLNVSITRARYLMVMVGDGSTVGKLEAFAHLLLTCASTKPGSTLLSHGVHGEQAIAAQDAMLRGLEHPNFSGGPRLISSRFDFFDILPRLCSN